MRLRGGLSGHLRQNRTAHTAVAPGTPICDRSSQRTHHGTVLSQPTSLRSLARAEIQIAARSDHAKAEEEAVRQAVDTCASKGMIILSERYFDRAMHKALWKMARPPHRLCRGTMRARLRPFLLHPRVWRERTALRKHGKGLCVRSPGEWVVRDMTDPSLPLSPLRATSSNRSFKLQLQRMDNINAAAATTDGKRPMMYQMKVPNWPALRPIVSPPAAPPPPPTPSMPPPAPPPPTAA